MVRDAVLREIIGAHPVGSVAAADLAFALGCDGRGLLCLLGLVELRAQYFHGLVLILVLAALVLTLDHNARGDMGYADGAFGLVDVLASRAGGTVGVYLKIVGVNVKLNLIGLGKHGDRCGRGVYPAAALGLRHALHAVASGLELEP